MTVVEDHAPMSVLLRYGVVPACVEITVWRVVGTS